MKVQRTRSQDRIIQLLKQLDREISAQGLYVALRQANIPLGLATVYRALEALKLAGVVQARVLRNGETLYSQAQFDRHHLTCLQCGTSVPLNEEDCPVQALEKNLRQSAHFEIYYHTLEFFGLCSPCQQVQATDDPEHGSAEVN
jgi:Fur family transcriptional regulator, ferric uptake regulator